MIFLLYLSKKVLYRMKITYSLFLFVSLLQTMLYADSSALRKILSDFQYIAQDSSTSIQDPDIVKLEPFPVVEEGFDDRKWRRLNTSLHNRNKLTRFEKMQQVNMFGTSLFVDGGQAYDSDESHGGGGYEIPLVSNFRNINKKIKGGIVLSENATLYLRTGVRWKIPGLSDKIQIWLPYRRKSTLGIGLRIEN